MQLTHLFLLFALLCPALLGCGKDGNKQVTTSELQSYVDNNPEAVARQRAAREADDE